MRIAIVNQRYGMEVAGGSELYTRELAELLNRHYQVEVLTTCALDYVNWDNHYKKGLSTVNGVKVRRFTVERLRNTLHFNTLYSALVESVALGKNTPEQEQQWVDEQGPYCPELVTYIKKNRDKYDVFVFITYLYYPTVRGLEWVKDKAILFPTAHDEPPIYFDIYKQIFNAPKALGFLTQEERVFVHDFFCNQHIPNDILGYGIDLPEVIDAPAFCLKYELYSDYIIYVGRVEPSKGCDVLINYFVNYKKRHPSNLKLVLVGKVFFQLPYHPDIISLGFISDEDKYNGIAGARVLVLPSQYESLSIVTLEALAVGTQVLVNGDSDVLKMHCQRSNAGLHYTSYPEFVCALKYLLTHDDTCAKMRENGISYVKENYDARSIVVKFKNLAGTLNTIKTD